jgi:hypothetical protein
MLSRNLSKNHDFSNLNTFFRVLKNQCFIAKISKRADTFSWECKYPLEYFEKRSNWLNLVQTFLDYEFCQCLFSFKEFGRDMQAWFQLGTCPEKTVNTPLYTPILFYEERSNSVTPWQLSKTLCFSLLSCSLVMSEFIPLSFLNLYNKDWSLNVCHTFCACEPYLLPQFWPDMYPKSTHGLLVRRQR